MDSIFGIDTAFEGIDLSVRHRDAVYMISVPSGVTWGLRDGVSAVNRNTLYHCLEIAGDRLTLALMPDSAAAAH